MVQDISYGPTTSSQSDLLKSLDTHWTCLLP